MREWLPILKSTSPDHRFMAIAGSDTTSNTSCAVLYHLNTHPQYLKKLRQELDDSLQHAEDVPLYSDVQELPYLNAGEHPFRTLCAITRANHVLYSQS